MTKYMQLFCGMFLALFLAACGSDVVPTATAPPRPTATPLSTPLPDVPTLIPAGFNEDNPLRLVIVPNDADAASDLVEELEAQIAGRTTLTLEVELADTQAEALAAVCNSTSGEVTLAWIDGLTLAAAIGQDCGVPALQIQRGTGRNVDTGEAGVILVNAEATGENAELDVIPDNTFCRTTYSDTYSWIIPMMMLRGAGFDIASLTDVDERADYDELLAGVSTGTCVAIGLPETVWEEYEDAYDDDEIPLEEVVREVETSAELPYGVLVVPFAATLDAINQVTEALLAIDVLFGEAEPIATPEPEETAEATEATDDDTDDADVEPTAEATSEVSDDSQLNGELTAFFGEGILVRVDISDFSELTDFLESTGLNFEQIGN